MGGGGMADLKLDTAQLRKTGTDLRLVATEFEHANARSEQLGEALGHAKLASKVRDFAHKWDDTRGKMVDAIASLAEACKDIGEGFESLDTELAAALRGES